VLFGLYVQHETPVIMETPPFLANIMSNAIHSIQAIWPVGPSCSAIPLMASLV
jgi:hypothetical protein